MRSLLYLHDDPDDAFYGKFWEAVRGYEHLKACEDYGKGAAAGLDYALPLEEKEREALKTMAGSPSFEENRERLEKMRDALP